MNFEMIILALNCLIFLIVLGAGTVDPFSLIYGVKLMTPKTAAGRKWLRIAEWKADTDAVSSLF